jgi:hypothetical protein
MFVNSFITNLFQFCLIFFLKKKLPIQMFEKEKENPPVVVAADVGAGGGRRRRRWCGC